MDIKNGLIHGESEKVSLSPSGKRVSAEKLRFSSDPSRSGEASDMDQFKNTGGFLNLKHVGIEVGHVSYSQEKGLEYSGFSFKPAQIRIGTKNTGVTVDFANKKIEGDLNWSFPPGGGNNDQGDYEAPKLLGAGVNVMVVPGIFVGGGVGVGAGLQLSGKTLFAKEGEPSSPEYKIEGRLGLQANAWVGADIHIAVGAAGIASLQAAVEAKAGIPLKAGVDLSGILSYENKSLSVKSASMTYDMSAAVEIGLAAKISGKILFFSERTLYQKDLGKWKLGDIQLKGRIGWDGEKLETEKLKQSITLGGKAITDGSLDETSISLEDKGRAVIPKKDKKAKLEELLQLEEERKKAEDILLDGQAVWGKEGGEAAKAVTEQIESLADIYDKRMEGMTKRIEALCRERDAQWDKHELLNEESKIRAAIAEDMEKTISDMEEDGFAGTVDYQEKRREMAEAYVRTFRRRYLEHIRHLMIVVFGLNETYLSNVQDNSRSFEQCEEKVSRLRAIKEDLGVSDTAVDEMKKIWGERRKIKGWDKAEKGQGTRSMSGVITKMLSDKRYKRSNAVKEMKDAFMEDYKGSGGSSGRLGIVNREKKMDAFYNSKEGLARYGGMLKDMSGDKAKAMEKEYQTKMVVYRRAMEQSSQVMAELRSLKELRNKMDGFLKLAPEQTQEKKSEFQDICSRIREYKIRENIANVQKSEDALVAFQRQEQQAG